MRVRTFHVNVFLDKNELSHLEKICKESGLGKSKVIRNLIMGVEIKPQPTEKQLRLVREISGIANNINQITRLANTVKSVSPHAGGGTAAAVQRGAFACKGESVNGIHKNISDPHPP